MKSPPHTPHQDFPVHRSLGLEALFQQLDQNRLCSILDLGPASGTNFRFWSPLISRMTFADYYRTWEEEGFPRPEEGGSYEPIVSGLLSSVVSGEYDLILAWDLFNYLEPEQIHAVAQHLQGHCSSEAMLLAMISPAPLIPAQPTTFKIVDREHLCYESRGPVTRNCPRYQTRDLSRLMPDFRVINSFLLRHGIQEYLFLYQSSPV